MVEYEKEALVEGVTQLREASEREKQWLKELHN